MRLLTALLFTAILTAAPARAQTPAASSVPEQSSAQQDAVTKPAPADPAQLTLPVSVDKIREALEQTPVVSLRTLDERPTFRVMIRERQRIEELLATMNFKSTSPAPGGGLYGYEMQRQAFPTVDNPLRQPYSAFNQSQLLTILVENLVRSYLSDKVTSTISKAERAHAEANAREEVRAAVQQYCNGQPNGGAGYQICTTVQ